MVNVVTTSKEINNKLLELVARNNEKIEGVNQLPKVVREHMDMEVFDDIQFLLTYINSLHALLKELAEDPSLDTRNKRKFHFG